LGSANAGAALAKTAHSAQINPTKLLDLFPLETGVGSRGGSFKVQSLASPGAGVAPVADPRLGRTEEALPPIRFAQYMIWYNASRNLGVPRP
jgi:hypothetical protein